jgi:hypothetical protein
MKVKGWISYDDADELTSSVGGMGGWFQNGLRWKDYIETANFLQVPYFEAIRKEIIAKGIRYTGQEHQYSDSGVPVFDDGTCGSFSFRAWGDLMAAIWSTEEDKDYCYMDFYM